MRRRNYVYRIQIRAERRHGTALVTIRQERHEDTARAFAESVKLRRDLDGEYDHDELRILHGQTVVLHWRRDGKITHAMTLEERVMELAEQVAALARLHGNS